VDMWSLGVLLYAMLCKTVPFKAANMDDLHQLIKKGEFSYPVPLSEEAKDLVGGLLRLNPKERYTVP